MAYVLNALIGDAAVLRAAGDFQVVDLPLAKGLIPLTDSFWKQHGHWSQPILREREARQAADSEFEHPDERKKSVERAVAAFARLAEVCVELSRSGAVAYLEAESFGGAGGQAGALWEHGVMTLGPVVAEDAINQVLSKLGVTSATTDEFEVLGLGRHRRTEEWLRIG